MDGSTQLSRDEPAILPAQASVPAPGGRTEPTLGSPDGAPNESKVALSVGGSAAPRALGTCCPYLRE